MYYESYEKPKRRRRKRRSFGAWLTGSLLKLIATILILAILAASALYAVPVSFFQIEPDGNDLSLTDGLPGSRINILLLGTDILNHDSQRSDAMIIATIGYKTLKLTSILRDTIVDIPGHGSGKLNSAYAYGGPELVMKTLNSNFKLNIMHYIAVDFVSLVKIVDAIGGVDIDITEAEMQHINKNVYSARKVFKPLGYTATELTEYGEGTHLNGMRALGYARIRKLDSDFMRTSRQRILLKSMLQKIRENIWNPLMLYNLGEALLDSLNTNMSIVHLISLGEKALLAEDIKQMRLPVDNAYYDNGSTLAITDMQANIKAFFNFAYE